MAAGPPLESCQVRIDSVTVPGKDDAAQAIVTLSKKEAHAFVRAVRKFGILSRMQEIAAESNSYVAEELDNAGRKVVGARLERAQCRLCFGIISGDFW